MVDKYVLRTPGLATSRIVLKTGKESLADVSSVTQATGDPAMSAPPDVINEQDVEIRYREYTDKLEALEQEKIRLEQIEMELVEQKSKLEAEKNTYRDTLRKEIGDEVEARLSRDYAERNAELIELIDTLSECKRSEIDKFDDELIAITYEAVCKVIGQSMTNSEVVISVVREVISHTQDRMHMILRVCPQHFNVIQNAKDMLSRGLSNRLEIVADDHVKYGGCIIETDAGSIDGRLEKQLDSLLALLLDERERQPEIMV